MALPLFDADAFPHADTTSGALPQPRDTRQGGSMARGEHRAETSDHTRESDESGGHRPGDPSGDQPGSMDHGSGESMMPSRSLLGLSTRRFTVASGYVALGLIALTLLIGPANLLLRRPNPVSTYLARDVGTWAAIVSVVHVFFGLQVHRRLSDFVNYFVARDGRPLTNSFGLGNWTGLAATVIVVALLATSSNFALRKLKATRWKRIQRMNYALFALVIAHAFLYRAFLRRGSPFTLLLLLCVTGVIVGQAVGVWLWRRTHARASA